MDSGYALLLTAATVAALILATFFVINQKSVQSKREVTEIDSDVSPSSEALNETSDTSPDAPSTGGGSEAMGSAEDADGPIHPSIMPSSDDDLWKVWFDQPSNSKGMTKAQFEDSMKVLGTFNTMADFWDRFSNLMHEKLPTKSNVRVFQSNVRPLYEDPINREGGKWIVVIPKQKSVGVFNEVLAAIVGGKFNCEISGLVLSKKVREDLVSIWTPSGIPTPSLEVLRDSIGDLLETHLGLKPEITFMSHDKKNRVTIQGKGEKGSKDGKVGHKAKFTGVKPKSPGIKPKSPGLKPKSPQTAPLKEGGKPAGGMAPTANAWGAGVPSSVKTAPSQPTPEESPDVPAAAAQPETKTGAAQSSPEEGAVEDTPEGGDEVDEGASPAVPSGEPESDGWEVVRSKPTKKGKGRNRYGSL